MRAFPFLFVAFLCHSWMYGATLFVGEGEHYATPHEAVASVLDGDTIIINEGTYRFSKSIALCDLEGVVIMGKGDVYLLCDNMEDNVCWITGCRGITVRNVHAKHTDPAEDERCYGNVFGIDTAEDIVITDCEIHGCGAIGVYVYNSDSILLKDNHIHDNRFWAVQFEGRGLLDEDEMIEGLILEGNIMERNGCEEDVVYGEGFSIASFITIEEGDAIYAFFKEDETGDTLRFLVTEDCYECSPILYDAGEHRGETMEVEWEAVGIIIPGTDECVKIKRISSILILD